MMLGRVSPPFSRNGGPIGKRRSKVSTLIGHGFDAFPL